MVESTVDLRVVNARVVTPDGTINGSVAANDGIIVGVGTESNLPEADREIDAEGNYLIPGFIDPHVHWGSHGTSSTTTRASSTTSRPKRAVRSTAA